MLCIREKKKKRVATLQLLAFLETNKHMVQAYEKYLCFAGRKIFKPSQCIRQELEKSKAVDFLLGPAKFKIMQINFRILQRRLRGRKISMTGFSIIE